MEQDLFSYSHASSQVLGGSGDIAGLRDCAGDGVDRRGKSEDGETLIEAWISPKRTRKITRGRDVVGRHTVKLLRERFNKKTREHEVKVRVWRCSKNGSKWSAGEWIPRRLTNLEQGSHAV